MQNKETERMKTGTFFKKIFSARLWANLGLMLLVVVALCFGVKFGIDLYTHHGEEVRIPDVKHKLYADAEHLLESEGLRIEVSDTGYVKTLPPDCVLEQSPEAGRKVKPGRVIYVVINSSHSPMLTIPDIIDNCSYREARAKLIAMGFKVGPAEYIPGEKDWVYGLKARGRNLQTGQRVSVNDVLIIQVGDGMRDMSDSVEYADPEYYYEERADSVGSHASSDDGSSYSNQPSGDVDEFEVVTGPE